MASTGHSPSILRRLRPTSPAAAGARPGGNGSATLTSPPTGQLVMKARETLRDLPPVREARVRELRALVGTGKYRVNAESVAAAMLEAQEAAGQECTRRPGA